MTTEFMQGFCHDAELQALKIPGREGCQEVVGQHKAL
jgi:hypothetical protein